DGIRDRTVTGVQTCALPILELADVLLAEHSVTEDLRQLVLEKAEGNPLFVEETIRMLVEQDGRPVELIPDTLQALIAARIDRLRSEERRVGKECRARRATHT